MILQSLLSRHWRPANLSEADVWVAMLCHWYPTGIQVILDNLKIAKIECRREDDPEVAKHTHARQVI